MNLLLLSADDLISPNCARFSDRRVQHLNTVLNVKHGDTIKVGIINGAICAAHIRHLDATSVELELAPEPKHKSPPPALPVTLIVALPRPKMLKRIIQTSATLGVKRLHFIHSYRVEKSYWQTPLLRPDAVRQNLLLGLEQAGDTMLPEVSLHKRFKPFVEDQLPEIVFGSQGLVAHPAAGTGVPSGVDEKITLVIGPEGGFIPYEIEKLVAAGCTPVSLGPRILRVETAIPVLLSRLFSTG